MYNPYMNQYYNTQPINRQIPIDMTQNLNRLNGKQVDSIDVVKAIDIPLDGSISYFPLTNGNIIATKQLQSDGTSKILIYKQIEEKRESNDLREEIENIKKEIAELKKGHENE